MLYSADAEKPNAEALKIRLLVALKQHICGNLQSSHGKFTAFIDTVIIGKADRNTRRIEPVSYNRDKAEALCQYSKPRSANKILMYKKMP